MPKTRKERRSTRRDVYLGEKKILFHANDGFHSSINLFAIIIL